MVVDRWKWIRSQLKNAPKGKLIDIGCGSGAFRIGSGRLGYKALGLSWDDRNQSIANARAKIIRVNDSVKFEILDVRNLDSRTNLVN